MAKVLRWTGIILIALLLIISLFYLTGNEQALKNLARGIWAVLQTVWLWLVGLAGLIGALFKKLASIFGPSKAEKEIRSENEQIRKELDSIRAEIAATTERLQRERNLHQREIELYEKEIAEKSARINEIKARIGHMEEAGPEGHYDEMELSEKEQFERDIHRHVHEIGE
jgi:peptidoglycan hydrolase CwlO-like protein